MHRKNGMNKCKRKSVTQIKNLIRSAKGMLEVLCVEEMHETSTYIRKEGQKEQRKEANKEWTKKCVWKERMR